MPNCQSLSEIYRHTKVAEKTRYRHTAFWRNPSPAAAFAGIWDLWFTDAGVTPAWLKRDQEPSRNLLSNDDLENSLLASNSSKAAAQQVSRILPKNVLLLYTLIIQDLIDRLLKVTKQHWIQFQRAAHITDDHTDAENIGPPTSPLLLASYSVNVYLYFLFIWKVFSSTVNGTACRCYWLYHVKPSLLQLLEEFKAIFFFPQDCTSGFISYQL